MNNGTFINPNTKLPFGLKESPHKIIVFVNGICTRKVDFDENLCHLGKFSKYNVTGVHSPTFGIVKDLKCYFKALHFNVAYEAVRELEQIFDNFFRHSSSTATGLLIDHSRGCVYSKIFLMSSKPNLRKRIDYIGIAPGGYTSSTLCRSVRHYESKGDFFPLYDMIGRERCKNTIITLDPHPDACQWFDHSFMSLTYEKHLQEAIEEYNTR